MVGGCSLDLRAVPEMVDEMCEFTDKFGSDCSSKKLCVDCGTSKTPLWRGGPAGPKSLCNACGIRSRKKRWALDQMTKMSIKKDNNDSNISEKKMKQIVVANTNSNRNGSICNSTGSSGVGNSWDSSSNDKLMTMWEVLKPHNVRIEELNEEQQAAVLLMALSHGLNYS